MVNIFKAYTSAVKYEVCRKGDTTFLGRFTFGSLLNFEGLGRILTILARGYLPDINRARDALCAWCSIPEEMLERQNHMGTCCYRIAENFRL